MFVRKYLKIPDGKKNTNKDKTTYIKGKTYLNFTFFNIFILFFPSVILSDPPAGGESKDLVRFLDFVSLRSK